MLPEGHALVFAGIPVSCSLAGVPAKSSLISTMAVLFQKQGWAVGSRGCGACWLRLCAQHRGGDLGPCVELTQASRICLSAEAVLDLFCEAAVSSEKQSSAPHGTSFLFSDPLENPVTGLPRVTGVQW